MYPQIVELKTLGKFKINPEEVKQHYIDTGRMKQTEFGQIVMDPATHTMVDDKNWVATLIEERPKYNSCGQCGKFLSYTAIDYANIKRMGESARVLYVEEAEKQRRLDEIENQELHKDPLTPSNAFRHIRSDTEIMVDSYVYKSKYIASVLDGLEENAKNAREGKEVDGKVIICDVCTNGTWWSQIP